MKKVENFAKNNTNKIKKKIENMGTK